MYKPSIFISLSKGGDMRGAELCADCVNCALKYDLKKYFLEPAGYEEIEPAENPLEDARITAEEIAMVDIPKLMSAYADIRLDFLCPDACRFGSDVCNLNGFFAAKFLQLVKIVKARELYRPDIVCEIMLHYLGKCGSTSGDTGFKHAEEVSDIFYEDLKDLEDVGYLRPGEANALFKSSDILHLGGLWDADASLEIFPVFHDLNSRYYSRAISEDDFMEYMLEDSDCSEEYWKNVYCSVGFEMPQMILKVLRKVATIVGSVNMEVHIWEWVQMAIEERDLSAKNACNDVNKFQPVMC